MDRRRRVWVAQRPDRENLSIEWIDANGRRRSKSAGTSDRKRAEDVAADFEYRLNHGLLDTPDPMAWSMFREKYTAESACHLKIRSQEKLDNVLDKFEDLAKPSNLSNCTDEMVSKFAAALRENGFKPISIRNYLTAIKTVLKWAVEQKLLESMPTFPKIRVPKTKPPIVPSEAVDRLFEKAPDEQWRALFSFAWWGGLRLSEILNLRWNRSSDYPYLEGNRIWFPALASKNGLEQWVPIHSELSRVIEVLPRRGETVLALRWKNGSLMPRAAVSNTVGQISRAAGVKLSMHKLRKGFGSRIAAVIGEGGAPVLHTLMRHSSMQVTMDHYANVDGALFRAIEMI